MTKARRLVDKRPGRTAEDGHEFYTPAPSAGLAARRVLEVSAVALLLTLLVGRCMLAEMPFRSSPVNLPIQMYVAGQEGGAEIALDRGELARVVIALGLLAGPALWLLAGAVGGRLELRHGWLWGLGLGFASWSMASAMEAPEARTAWVVWLEQVSLVAAALTLTQLLRSRRAWAMVLAVLAAVAAMYLGKGLWQLFVEVPDRIADFQAHRADRLGSFGWAVDSPQAKLIESRMTDPSLLGFFPLANLFAAALLIVTAGATGLAVDAWRRLVLLGRIPADQRTGEERGLAGIAAVLMTTVAAGAGLCLVLTGSRGAWVSAVALTVPTVLVLVARKWGRWWREALVLGGALLLAGVLSVAGMGLSSGRLPTKSMTFRWYYWSAAGRISLEHPLLGVGPGNFPNAYLQARQPEAEESVKTPHNAPLHALVQFGWPGGAMYLALLAGMAITACRPNSPLARPDRRKEPEPGETEDADAEAQDGEAAAEAADPAPPAEPEPSSPPPEPAPPEVGPSPTQAAVAMVGICLGALLLRGWLAGAGGSGAVFFLETFTGAVGLVLGLPLAGWAAGLFGGLRGRPGRAGRICLVAGVGAFLLHNMVSFGLWMPAPATLGWFALAAAVAYARLGRPGHVLRGSLSAGLAASVAGGLWIAAMITFFLPVAVKFGHYETARRALAAGNLPAARTALEKGARADRLDPIPASETARLALLGAPRDNPPVAEAALDQAARWAAEATRRSPKDPGLWQLRGAVERYRTEPDFFQYAWQPSDDPEQLARLAGLLQAQAVNATRPPERALLWNDLAKVMATMGRFRDAVEAYMAALAIDRDSVALYRDLGDALYQAGRVLEARGAWQRARELLDVLQTGQAAIEAYRQAVALDPMDARARMNLAETLLDFGQVDPARQQLRQAEGIQAALEPVSVQRLNPRERLRIELMRARADALAGE